MADRYEEIAAVAKAIARVQLNGGDPEQPAMRWNGTQNEPQDFPVWHDYRDEAVAAVAVLRDQDAWWPIDDPEHPAPRDGTPFIGGVWLRADQRWHCTITAWMPWWNKDGCPFDIWSPVRLPPPPMSRREG